jgi:hypothetical protein
LELRRACYRERTSARATLRRLDGRPVRGFASSLMFWVAISTAAISDGPRPLNPTVPSRVWPRRITTHQPYARSISNVSLGASDNESSFYFVQQTENAGAPVDIQYVSRLCHGLNALNDAHHDCAKLKKTKTLGFLRDLVPEVGIEPTRGVNPTGF